MDDLDNGYTHITVTSFREDFGPMTRHYVAGLIKRAEAAERERDQARAEVECVRAWARHWKRLAKSTDFVCVKWEGLAERLRAEVERLQQHILDSNKAQETVLAMARDEAARLRKCT